VGESCKHVRSLENLTNPFRRVYSFLWLWFRCYLWRSFEPQSHHITTAPCAHSKPTAALASNPTSSTVAPSLSLLLAAIHRFTSREQQHWLSILKHAKP
jgi:hypothetical protein